MAQVRWDFYSRSRVRAGVTLVELMVAIALTLLVILAVVRIFDLLGSNVTQSRSILELSARSRTLSGQLQTDLDSLTVQPTPPVDPDAAPGYFEIVEGIRSDADSDGDLQVDIDLATGLPIPLNPFYVKPYSQIANDRVSSNFLQEASGILGDTDDLWMGTVRSTGEPFRGRYTGVGVTQVQTSKYAEVVWWVEPIREVPSGGLRLIRRALLIRPDLTFNAIPFANIPDFLRANDVSVHFIQNGSQYLPVANTLADLSGRHNRFAHWFRADYGNQVIRWGTAVSGSFHPQNLIDPQYLVYTNDDVLTSDIVAFDLRVYDPLAPVHLQPSASPLPIPITPVEPGYRQLASTLNHWTNPPIRGAYVDLGFSFTSPSLATLVRDPAFPHSNFSGLPAPKSQILQPQNAQFPVAPQLQPRVYCTWSTKYERDGLDQNQIRQADEGTNGVDDGTTGSAGYLLAPDDKNEQETEPPYVAPLRGIEVLLRLRDISSQQVRQSSVVVDFVTH